MTGSESIPKVDVLPGQSQAPIDVAAVLKRCGGDAKFAAAVTERFRSQAGQEVQRVASALAEGDSDSLRRSAHTVKSMAAYMGAQHAAALAKQIEDLARAQQLDDVEKLVNMLREQVDQTTAWIAQSMNPAVFKSM